VYSARHPAHKTKNYHSTDTSYKHCLHSTQYIRGTYWVTGFLGILLCIRQLISIGEGLGMAAVVIPGKNIETDSSFSRNGRQAGPEEPQETWSILGRDTVMWTCRSMCWTIVKVGVELLSMPFVTLPEFTTFVSIFISLLPAQKTLPKSSSAEKKRNS